MNLLICKTEGNDFVLSNGVRPKFTVIGQQEAVSPESGQLPARAFENKTVFLQGARHSHGRRLDFLHPCRGRFGITTRFHRKGRLRRQRITCFDWGFQLI